MTSLINTLSLFASVALLSLGMAAAKAQNAPQSMRFFVTSVGSGNGGNLGGLDGADARCQSLAAAVGAGARTWHAYLSRQATAGIPAVNARDRVGNGPWYNAKATLIDRKGVGAAPVDEAQRGQLISQFRQRASRAFLRAYWDATGTRSGPATRALLDLFLIEKTAYEIAYEATNRPTWIGVPVAGLARLATHILDKETGGRNS